jgi:iron complex transport system substrate-binding protein
VTLSRTLTRTGTARPSRIAARPGLVVQKVLLRLLLAVLGWAGVSAACAQPVSVIDDAGQILTLERPAERIVSLSPHITELLFAAGAGDRIVGVDAWSNYPAPATRLPRVGDLYALDLERIVALKPDLLVVWHQGNSQRQLDVLRALGLPVYHDGPRRLDDIASSLERLGRIAGQGRAAQAAADTLRAQLGALRREHAGQAPVSVFYQVWNEPLLTVNDSTLIGDVIELCGGRNVFGHLPMQAPRVGVEAVIEADPQVIVAAALAMPEAGSKDKPASSSAGYDPAFALWRRWPRLRAVREHHLVALPDDLISRHSPRVLQGARRLCQALQSARTRP